MTVSSNIYINIEGPGDLVEAKERCIIVSSYLLRETKYGGKHFSSIEMLQLRGGGETSFLMTCQSACCVRDVKMSGVSSDISLGTGGLLLSPPHWTSSAICSQITEECQKQS